jgi:hypothetical protein
MLASLIAEGPNLDPGLKEVEESKGNPTTVQFFD